MATLTWTAWPVRRSPARAAGAVAFLALLGWTLQALVDNVFFTFVGLLLVWGQIASFFLPTTYELTDDTVSVRGLLARREKSWSDFRSYQADRDGILLSPFAERSRLERFRGLSLQFHGNRNDVVSFVERTMGDRGGPAADVGDEGPGGERGPKAGAA